MSNRQNLRYRIRTYAIALLTLTASVRAAAPDSLNAELESIREQHPTPALAALLMRGGEIVAEGVSGERSMTDSTPVTHESRWHLGSNSKSMTATLAAVFVERGELSWDFTVGQAFSGGDIAVHEGYRDVTLRELLNHTSGIPEALVGKPIWLKLRMSQDPPREQRRMLARTVLADPPGHPRGEFHYCNAGTVIAALMLEERIGKDYEELLVERVFRPLGVTSGGFGPPEGDSDPLGHAGTRPMPALPIADNPPAITPAGRVHMTMRDWGRYAAEHLAGARGEPTKLLKAETYRVLHTPADGDGDHGYALGWGVGRAEWGGGRMLSHAGSNTMWYAKIIVLIDRNAVILAAANAADENARAAVDAAVAACARRAAEFEP